MGGVRMARTGDDRPALRLILQVLSSGRASARTPAGRDSPRVRPNDEPK